MNEQMMEYVSKLKKNARCSCCGTIKNSESFQFHHRNRLEKYKDVSYMINHNESNKSILREIGKCILVCDACHKRIHKVEDKEFMPNIIDRMNYFSHLDNYMMRKAIVRSKPFEIRDHFSKSTIWYRDFGLAQSLRKIIDKKIRSHLKCHYTASPAKLLELEQYSDSVVLA